MGRASGWATWSWNLIVGGFKLRGGLELNRTGLGEAARQAAPGSTRGLTEAGGDRQPHRSRTSSSLEGLLWWSLWRWGKPDTHFLLSPQLIRSSSSSDEWRSRLASSRRRRRRNRAGDTGPWLCCWLVAKGVRAQFLRLSEDVKARMSRKNPSQKNKKNSNATIYVHLVKINLNFVNHYLQEKLFRWLMYLCQSVRAPGSRLLSHHSPLPLHCHDRKS